MVWQYFAIFVGSHHVTASRQNTKPVFWIIEEHFMFFRVIYMCHYPIETFIAHINVPPQLIKHLACTVYVRLWGSLYRLSHVVV